MIRIESLHPQLVQLGSFLGFYGVIEFLFWRSAFMNNLTPLELFVLLLISFLNLIPAGIFSFLVSSLLPSKLCSSYNEQQLFSVPHRHTDQRVAVLYTTFNDFMADHAEYDLAEARKRDLTFFILDDSTDLVKRIE